ncbi:MAG: hypothetical protein WC753_00145 [Candidatus Gracilibacteria bacterium]
MKNLLQWHDGKLIQLTIAESEADTSGELRGKSSHSNVAKLKEVRFSEQTQCKTDWKNDTDSSAASLIFLASENPTAQNITLVAGKSVPISGNAKRNTSFISVNSIDVPGVGRNTGKFHTFPSGADTFNAILHRLACRFEEIMELESSCEQAIKTAKTTQLP